MILRNDEDGKLEMTVLNLSPEDTANYTCIADNEAGDNKLNGTLIVHCMQSLYLFLSYTICISLTRWHFNINICF